MSEKAGRVAPLALPGADPVSPLPAGSALVVGLASVLAVVLLLGVGLVAFRSGTAQADTLLVSGSDARLALLEGSTRPAVVGERVPPGATVLAGATGAVLQTRDRRVYLGRDTTVTVQDGARQALGRGFVMVDATEGPGLELTTAAGVVTAAAASLVRVDDGQLLRVGVLGGRAASVRAAGRRSTVEVDRYYQVQLARGGLPMAPTPLLLTGDAYERDLARGLYDADRDLNDVAGRLDAAGQAGPAVLLVLQAAVPNVSVPTVRLADSAAVVGAPGSERALSFLLASTERGGQLAARYERVRALRMAGGSWGVVAAIVDVTPNDVSAALAQLLSPDGNGVVTGPGPGATALGSLVTFPVGPEQAPGTFPPGGGPTSPRPSPSPSPLPPRSPSPDPADAPLPPTGVPLVDDVVQTVLDVASPSPSPSPSPSQSPVLPVAPPTVPLSVPLPAAARS